VGALLALLVAIAAEVLFYPPLATDLYLWTSGRTGWDGSGLRYVQTTFVAPTGTALALGMLLAAVWSARRRRRAFGRVVGVGWILNIALLLFSIAWYARMADRG
jgi:hypothetical protein